MAKSRLYITYKHQEWTFGDKENLVPLLDGDDDYIMECLATNTSFAIILRDGKTYKVKDTEKEAQDYIAVLYRFYAVNKNEDRNCYIDRNDISKRFLTNGDAMTAGVYDYVFVPTGQYFLTREGKIIAVGKTEQEVLQKMYDHFGATYTYIC